MAEQADIRSMFLAMRKRQGEPSSEKRDFSKRACMGDGDHDDEEDLPDTCDKDDIRSSEADDSDSDSTSSDDGAELVEGQVQKVEETPTHDGK